MKNDSEVRNGRVDVRDRIADDLGFVPGGVDCLEIDGSVFGQRHASVVADDPVARLADPVQRDHEFHIIREQGGIVAEPFYADKVLDFAMEFRATDEGVEFLGYSVFEADDTGHYGGNYVEDQPSLVKRIDLSESLLQDLVAYHQQELRKLNYRGPIGIDMMKLKDGRIHPCVEINFRMTMGMLAILLYNKGIREDQLLTPYREQGFVAEIRQGRFSIAFNKSC